MNATTTPALTASDRALVERLVEQAEYRDDTIHFLITARKIVGSGGPISSLKDLETYFIGIVHHEWEPNFPAWKKLKVGKRAAAKYYIRHRGAAAKAA